MGRDRPYLPTPFGTDGPWLQALVDAIYDLHDLIDARLPAGSTQPVAEPAPAGPPPGVVPVQEPAPDAPPTRPDELDEDDGPELLAAPPRAGRGSGLEAWQAWADSAGVDYPDDASRADIIAACEDAGVLPAE